MILDPEAVDRKESAISRENPALPLEVRDLQDSSSNARSILDGTIVTSPVSRHCNGKERVSLLKTQQQAAKRRASRKKDHLSLATNENEPYYQNSSPVSQGLADSTNISSTYPGAVAVQGIAP